MTTLRGKPGCAKGVSPASLLWPRGAAPRGFRAVARSHVTKTPLALAVPATRRRCGGQRHPTRLGSAPPLVSVSLDPTSLFLRVCLSAPALSACVFSSEAFFPSVTDPQHRIPVLFKKLFFFLVKRCISSISLYSLLKPHRTTPKGLANNKITNNHHIKKVDPRRKGEREKNRWREVWEQENRTLLFSRKRCGCKKDEFSADEEESQGRRPARPRERASCVNVPRAAAAVLLGTGGLSGRLCKKQLGPSCPLPPRVHGSVCAHTATSAGQRSSRRHAQRAGGREASGESLHRKRECSWPPTIHVLSPSPHSDGVRRRGLREVMKSRGWRPHDRISVLTERTPQSNPVPSTL